MLIQNIEYFFIVLINGLNVFLYYSVQEDKITGIERREKGTGGGVGRGGAGRGTASLHISPESAPGQGDEAVGSGWGQQGAGCRPPVTRLRPAPRPLTRAHITTTPSLAQCHASRRTASTSLDLK